MSEIFCWLLKSLQAGITDKSSPQRTFCLHALDKLKWKLFTI